MMRAQGMPIMMSGRMIMAVVFRAVAMRMTVGMSVGMTVSVLRGISVGVAQGMRRVSGVVLCCEILMRGAALR